MTNITVQLLELTCEIHMEKQLHWVLQTESSKRFKKNQIRFFMREIQNNPDYNPAAKLIFQQLTRDKIKSL
jgi:hypothetical protein